MAAYSLEDLAARLDARLVGDGRCRIRGVGALASATTDEVTHLSSASYRSLLPATRAGAVLLREADAAACPTNALIVADPYLAFARVSQLFLVEDGLPAGAHASAVVAADALVDPTACVGPHVVVGAGSRVGARVRLHAGVSIGERCTIGDDVEIRPNAVLYSDVSVGARSVVHAGAVLGGDGFGFAPDGAGRLHAIAQLGGVRIGEDVSIGSNTTIDRGAIEDTVIEDGVKIDNLVQVGHNCRIGAHSVLCGCVGLAGSTTIGRHCVLAGGSGVGGEHPVTLCDGVTLTATTIVTTSIDKPGVYSGSMLHNTHTRWKRIVLLLHGLDELVKRVRSLEKRLPEGRR
ncbi:MAG: UDP-3-O-(3-hydroxymyristoyl)glucosamine N-acyltransferase [Pseudomonadales bacterium]|nr:UDP-3-O-(3-hydroxymyristoyl)glucosamine N-acyltransferase [Pseudomonadales bacterium]MCP5182836.1 UDP-3-O-(3-hydroxymyristoyl)glucosamine N-acyltransferase [Pseudomonadales bacterium]